MTYRDEGDALRARVAELEGRLATAEARVAELSGTAARSAATEGEELGPLTAAGTPRWIRLTKTVDHTLTAEGYEALAALLRSRLGIAASQVGQALTTPGDVFSLRVEDGRTVLSLRGDWTSPVVTGALAALAPALFGGLFAAAVVGELLHLTEPLAAAQMLWAMPLVALTVTGVVAPRARARVQSQLAAHRGTFVALVELAEKHRATPVVRARVAVPPETSAGEHDADAEHEGARAQSSSEGR